MVKNPYIGMPIEITDWEDTPCEGCSTGGSGSDISPDSGNTGGSAGNDNNWQNDGTFDSMYLGSLPIAMCYVPNQRWKTTYSLDKALTVGTVFPELDLPFKGGMKR